MTVLLAFFCARLTKKCLTFTGHWIVTKKYVLDIFSWATLNPIYTLILCVGSVFRRLHKIAKSDYDLRHVCPSIRPHGTTRLLLDGFSWNFTFQYFSKTYRENSRCIKIWQELQVLYIKTNRHFWSYLSQFFLEWKMFETNIVEKIKTHILCSIILFF